MFERGGGILLHPTSLPGPNGIGELSEHALRFIDWLERAGIRYWQIMPLGPTGYGDSPYASSSAMAGNPLLISLDVLVEDGLLLQHELDSIQQLPADHVDFGPLIDAKTALLRTAFSRWQTSGGGDTPEFEQFSLANRGWLDDFTLFQAIKRDKGGVIWTEWPENLRSRNEQSLLEARLELADECAFYAFAQFLFSQQWERLKAYANTRNVQLIGDIPIFVAFDSVDVWANQHLFQLGDDGSPAVVSGVPPDYFSADGQLWGNPVFDWQANRETGFAWWVERVRSTLRMVDIIRIDHFRGFAASWSVPAGDQTASGGFWMRGPGEDVFDAIESALGHVAIIVEDLGLITQDVIALRDQLGYPGMSVLQFAFGDDPWNVYLPHMHQKNSVVYSGTHDNDTTLGWFKQLQEHDVTRIQTYLGRDGSDIAWDFIRLAFSSVADIAIVPLQDVLRLGGEARMNRPGSPLGNWSWRFEESQLHDELADGLRGIVEIYGRGTKSNELSESDPFDYTVEQTAHPLY